MKQITDPVTSRLSVRHMRLSALYYMSFDGRWMLKVLYTALGHLPVSLESDIDETKTDLTDLELRE